MRSRLLIAILLPFAIVLGACQPQAGPLSDEDVATIRSLGPALDQLALSGDWSAFVGMFTEDGVLMPPNEALLQMSDFLAWIEPVGMTVTEHKVEFVDVDGSGDIAYGRATYSERYTVEGVSEPIEDTGKILAVLRKQPDGSWLFSMWAWSSDLPLMEGEHSAEEEHS